MIKSKKSSDNSGQTIKPPLQSRKQITGVVRLHLLYCNRMTFGLHSHTTPVNNSCAASELNKAVSHVWKKKCDYAID